MLVAVLSSAVVSWGCGGGGSGAVRRSISQVMEGARLDSLGGVAVLPCAARIDVHEDPDDIAPGMATSRLHAAIQRRSDGSRIVAKSMIEERDLAGELATFYRNWLPHPEEGDGEALQRIALRLQADVLLVAGVLQWKQTDKFTRVGMVAGLFEGVTGRMLWWSEQERQVEAAAEQFGPPDYLVVIDRVIEALLEPLPLTE